MKLYVVIVNYRRADLTVETVRSLRSCPECAHGCVVLVDNASGDGSSERFRAECFDCVVLGAGANRGFAGGNNIGIQYALEHGATHVLLLNNDTVVDSAFLGRLLAVMDEHAIVTPRIMYADSPSRVWYGGGFVSRKRGGFYHVTDPVLARKARDVSFASGCCLLIPSSFFTEHGLLDESYFLYYEDAELCLRAAASGYVIHYVPEAIVWHKVSSSTGGEDSDLSIYYGTRNRLRVLRQYRFPWYALCFVLLTRLIKGMKGVYSRKWRLVFVGIWDWLRGRTGLMPVGKG